jgi:hypothetical protein
MSTDYLWEPRDETVNIAPITSARDAIEQIRIADTCREYGRGAPAVYERAKAAARMQERAWAECEGAP